MARLSFGIFPSFIPILASMFGHVPDSKPVLHIALVEMNNLGNEQNILVFRVSLQTVLFFLFSFSVLVVSFLWNYLHLKLFSFMFSFFPVVVFLALVSGHNCLSSMCRTLSTFHQSLCLYNRNECVNLHVHVSRNAKKHLVPVILLFSSIHSFFILCRHSSLVISCFSLARCFLYSLFFDFFS